MKRVLGIFGIPLVSAVINEQRKGTDPLIRDGCETQPHPFLLDADELLMIPVISVQAGFSAHRPYSTALLS